MINNRMLRYVFIFVLIFGLSVSLFAQDNKKIAQTGFQYLSVVSDATAASMAEAVTTLNLKSSSMFFNPACMTEMNQMIDVSASYNELFADITHNTFSMSYKPADGLYGVIGLTFQSVDYGDNFFGTIVDPSVESGYRDTGDLSPTASSIGLGYAKALSAKFSIGAHVRWNKQDFGTVIQPIMETIDTLGAEMLGEEEKSYSQTPVSFDFGTLYKTGFKSLVFGMSIRNFSGEVEYIREAFQLPLVFTRGIHMDMMDFIDEGTRMHRAFLVFNTSHFRSRPEEYQFALNYSFMDYFSLRAGYVTGRDEESVAFGVGFNVKDYFTFDYAYIPLDVFDKSQRYTIRFSF